MVGLSLCTQLLGPQFLGPIRRGWTGAVAGPVLWLDRCCGWAGAVAGPVLWLWLQLYLLNHQAK
jgi:hypothetical protein